MMATETSVVFLKPSGETASRLERTGNTRVFVSRGGKFIGVQELLDSGGKPGSPWSLSFSLYDHRGGKLWSRKQPLGTDEPMPSFYISDLGRVVMVEPLEGALSFFDLAGSLAHRVRLFPRAPAEMERPVACAFSADGNYLVVNALRQHSRPDTKLAPQERGQSFLILFDDQGQQIWRRELKQEISDRVEISRGGQMIVAGGYSVRGLNALERATYLYNAAGELLHTLDFSFRQAAFCATGRFLLLGQKNAVRLVDTQTAHVLWERELPKEEGQIRALDLSPEANLALVEVARGMYQGPRFLYRSPQILLFDRQGHQVWEERFQEDSFLQPLVRFLKDGSRILLAFRDRYLLYARDE